MLYSTRNYIQYPVINHMGKEKRIHMSVTQLCPIPCNPWTVAHQAPLSMEFSRKEYWNGLPFPSPADLSNPGIKPKSLALQADSLPAEPPVKLICMYI